MLWATIRTKTAGKRAKPHEVTGLFVKWIWFQIPCITQQLQQQQQQQQRTSQLWSGHPTLSTSHCPGQVQKSQKTCATIMPNWEWAQWASTPKWALRPWLPHHSHHQAVAQGKILWVPMFIIKFKRRQRCLYTIYGWVLTKMTKYNG